jgi:hypothetical protein
MSKKIIVISTSAMAIILFLGVMLFVNTDATCAQTPAGCAPYTAKMPSIQRLYEKMKNEGVYFYLHLAKR